VVALGLVAAACQSDGGDDDAAAGEAPATSETTEVVVVPSVDEAPEALLDGRPYPVGQRSETVVDATRGTQALPAQGLGAHSDRTIALTILYPGAPDEADADVAGGDVAGGGSRDRAAEPVDGAPAADGRFPLLVFAHGWTGTGPSLVPAAQHWAEAGYVVALPTFPLSKEGIGFSGDLPQQPGDVSFTIDTVLGYGDDPDDPLGGHVDPGHVAVGGHSLGGATAFGFLNTCCEDPRVDAVVSVAGGTLPYEGGDYPPDLALPLLLVHGGRDTIVPHAASDFVVENFTGTVDYLFIAEGTHLSMFGGDEEELLDRALLGFLDVELGLDPAALDGVADEVDATGLATFRST
jgi:dienelactone hydrolase